MAYTLYRTAVQKEARKALATYADPFEAIASLKQQCPTVASSYAVTDDNGYTVASYTLNALGFGTLSVPFSTHVVSSSDGPVAQTPIPPTRDRESGCLIDAIPDTDRAFKPITGPGRAARRAARKREAIVTVPSQEARPTTLDAMRSKIAKHGLTVPTSLDRIPIHHDTATAIGPAKPLASRLGGSRDPGTVARLNPPRSLQCDARAPQRPTGVQPVFTPDLIEEQPSPRIETRFVPIPARKPGRTRHRNWASKGGNK